jgi:hypothetical protein
VRRGEPGPDVTSKCIRLILRLSKSYLDSKNQAAMVCAATFTGVTSDVKQ